MATFISWLPNKKLPFLPILFPASNSPIERTSADLKRTVTKTESAHADTLRQVNSDVVRIDLKRQVVRQEIVRADAYRKITFTEKFSADTKIQIGITETIHADTFRLVGLTEIIPADLRRTLLEFTHADTFRKIVRTEKAIADTVIRVPHIWNYFLRPVTLRTAKLLGDNPVSLVNAFKDYGITAVNITLNEKTLSDSFTFETTKPVNINDAVQGTLLDYHFNFLVEETTQTDLNQEVKGMYSQDDLLYTWFSLDTSTYLKADEIIRSVAMYLGLAVHVSIDDFTPSNLQGDEKITYSDLLNSVFGWTSRLPQRQVNVFIRGGTLYCIQRGMEDSVFDISNLPHSRPTVNKKFNRVLCLNPNKNDDDDDDDDDDDGHKFNGTISYKKAGAAPFQERVYLEFSYNNGLLVKERMSTQTGMFANSDGETVILSNNSNTTYGYYTKLNQNSKEYEYYLSSKSQRTVTKEQNMKTLETYTTVQEITTSFGYNAESQTMETYLFHEQEQSTKTEYQSGSKEYEITKEIRDTYHVPLGNGWYAQTVYLNNIFQGANLSQGKPGNSVSPYTVKKAQETFKFYDINIQLPTTANDELSNIIDDSFPVRSEIEKAELNNALRWLHRKIQETVTLDLISPVKDGVPDITHIVDFTERVKLDGNEYFLVSNRITFTPRKLIQKLELIRWY